MIVPISTRSSPSRLHGPVGESRGDAIAIRPTPAPSSLSVSLGSVVLARVIFVIVFFGVVLRRISLGRVFFGFFGLGLFLFRVFVLLGVRLLVLGRLGLGFFGGLHGFLLGGLIFLGARLGLADGLDVAIEDLGALAVQVLEAGVGPDDADILLGVDLLGGALVGEPGAEDLGADAGAGLEGGLVVGAAGDQDVEDGGGIDRGLDQAGVGRGDDRLGDGAT